MIDFAIEMAVKAHRGQARKHTDIPYITHPIGVALLLAQSDCSDELITAGLLHEREKGTGLYFTALDKWVKVYPNMQI